MSSPSKDDSASNQKDPLQDINSQELQASPDKIIHDGDKNIFITDDDEQKKHNAEQKSPEEETEEEREERMRREEEELRRREEEEKVRKRQEQALMFEKYLEDSGLSLSFQIIFTELIQKQIAEDQVYAYTAMRLRQIGKELEQLENKNQK